jgi:hypothetical protein
MTNESYVELDATDPEELLAKRTPEGVWIRVESESGPGGGWPVVAIRGEPDAVREFVRENWGEDALEAIAEPSAAKTYCRVHEPGACYEGCPDAYGDERDGEFWKLVEAALVYLGDDATDAHYLPVSLRTYRREREESGILTWRDVFDRGLATGIEVLQAAAFRAKAEEETR